MHIMDLRPSGNARFHSAFDTMNVLIPRIALNELAGQLDSRPPEQLRVPHAWDWRDPIMDGLQTSIAWAIGVGPEVDDLVFDNLLLTLLTHAAITYGEMARPVAALRGALRGAQLSRAKDAIMESLENPVALAEIARRCDRQVAEPMAAGAAARAGPAPAARRRLFDRGSGDAGGLRRPEPLHPLLLAPPRPASRRLAQCARQARLAQVPLPPRRVAPLPPMVRRLSACMN
jgi:hypothetical protein